ncbi:glycosyltransferase family 4 protein [Pseudomonas sp. EYE_354]|uniref:glycosyltransferase family 4 protein n=1 Tax=Pseudomonas sp. EYE_354 TaxID=2853449 RepID=UPI0020062984|nr:glycosyltransferase family 4 protein [Pseudomonas sp. EYE_354]MCK6186791.1 glycosyltransferase family 4 protein [Pseudomonas sp. EYE_354]
MLKDLRVARVSTVPFFVVTQLKSQINTLCSNGVSVTIITSDEEFPGQLRQFNGANFISVNMARQINIVQDLSSLFKLYKVFKSEKFDIVHSTTPKAGLLCSIAARLAGVPVRLHTFTGQPWVTMSGVKKEILKLCDKIIAKLNTHCYADSLTQRDFLVGSKVVKKENISVLGLGSLSGVDLARFDKRKYSPLVISQLKNDLGIPENGKVILFVGRVTPEKGIRELIDAFVSVSATDDLIHLLLVGPTEDNGSDMFSSIENSPIWKKVHNVGFSDEPEKFMAAADILCLPSYREGFGTVVIEAAAMGIPTVGTSIYGLSDAVVDGVTGRLVPSMDSVALGRVLREVLGNSALMRDMGEKASARAIHEFDSIKLSNLMMDEYRKFSG